MKLTILTCSKEPDGLKTTLQSIAAQKFADYELIVVDGSGGNNDPVLAEFSELIKTVVKDEEKGVYPALNKAIGHVSGEYVLALHGGDTLMDPHILGNVSEYLLDDVVYGDIVLVHERIQPVVKRMPTELTLDSLKPGIPNHQAMFIKKDLLMVNPYDESYQILADLALLRSWMVAGKTIKHVPLLVANYKLGGLSSTIGNDTIKSEFARIQRS